MKLKTLVPKSEVRKIVVQRRSAITPVDIKNKTKLIFDRFTATDDFVNARRIHTYISTRPGEIDTRKLVDYMDECGKHIVVPKLNKKSETFHRANFINWDHMVKNNDGYLEPKVGNDEDLSDIDLIIVPAVAVSILGQRVGYGGGFYDKLLRQTFAVKIVLAFEFQVFDYIESNAHDIRIDKIITELRIINTRPPINRSSELL
ncbi:MAG: 5-formyltetrahydrofolate cyclo-ligase [Melioribacteraceae bacterium]|nr:5-formyltetrahydrofolate cyclo-ligase [Melioribacteraceae bacterium]